MGDMTPLEGAVTPVDRLLVCATGSPKIGGKTLLVIMNVAVPSTTDG